jgi:phage anti-repressor protein
MLNINENNKVDAREIYDFIEVKSRFNGWINESLNFIGAKENKDFCRKKGKSTGGRPTIEYDISIECAKELCLIQRNEKSKQLRLWLISLSNQHDTGLAFTTPQIEALMDLSKAMTLISIQKEVEKKHFAIYNDKYTWYKYRAELLGYNTNEVIEAMRNVNKKHHSIRASLVQLDANELIRVGVIDFMIAIGKSNEYATNAGNLCKSMAARMKLGNIIWDDTKENPLKINQSEIIERQNGYNQVKGLLGFN